MSQNDDNNETQNNLNLWNEMISQSTTSTNQLNVQTEPFDLTIDNRKEFLKIYNNEELENISNNTGYIHTITNTTPGNITNITGNYKQHMTTNNHQNNKQLYNTQENYSNDTSTNITPSITETDTNESSELIKYLNEENEFLNSCMTQTKIQLLEKHKESTRFYRHYRITKHALFKAKNTANLQLQNINRLRNHINDTNKYLNSLKSSNLISQQYNNTTLLNNQYQNRNNTGKTINKNKQKINKTAKSQNHQVSTPQIYTIQ